MKTADQILARSNQKAISGPVHESRQEAPRSPRSVLAFCGRKVAVLRRQVSRLPFRPADRALLAALARLLPRERWGSLIVCPATVRRWHRDALARRWTYTRRGSGRPAIEARVAELMVRLARENPTWGTGASKVNSPPAMSEAMAPAEQI